MIGTLFVVGVILAVGVTIVAIVIGGLFSPAKLLLALISTGTAVVIAVVVTVGLSSEGRAPAMNDFSHAQLEADRVMTADGYGRRPGDGCTDGNRRHAPALVERRVPASAGGAHLPGGPHVRPSPVTHPGSRFVRSA